MFPAGRRPRPLILLSSAVQPGGFPDAQKKMAFLQGSIEAPPDFPAQLLQALRGHPRPWEGSPLLLTSATLGEREFATDRGRKRLPAWCVWAQDVPEPVWVLDPAASSQSWQPPGQESSAWHRQEAVLGTDGRTLTLSFTGSPERYTSYPRGPGPGIGQRHSISKELVTGPRQAVGRTRH